MSDQNNSSPQGEDKNKEERINQRPVFFLLSGPPGAGKSTSGLAIAPPEIKEILDFDGLRYDETGRFMRNYKGTPLEEADREAIQYAGNYMDDKIDTALSNKTSFGVEDMIWGEKAWVGAKNIQEAGYEFHLTYLGLEGAELSASRVERRIAEGGHDYVTPEEARECYEGNLKMLDKNYQQPDRLEIYDNSTPNTGFVVSFNKGQIDEVGKGETPEWIWESLPNIYEKIEAHKEGLQLKAENPVQQKQATEKKPDQSQDRGNSKEQAPKNKRGFRI